ncbi:MAG: DUF5715 family protein [Terracidiphilus sp.]
MAALSVSSANGSTVTPAKTHRHAHSTAPAHSTPKRAERATSQHTPSQHATPQHATPEEVGRASGLKIRRDLARRHAAAATAHRVRPSQAYPERRGAVTAEAPHPNREYPAHKTEVASFKAKTPTGKPKKQVAEARVSNEPSASAKSSPVAKSSPAFEPEPSPEPGSGTEAASSSEPSATADPSPSAVTRRSPATETVDEADPEPAKETQTKAGTQTEESAAAAFVSEDPAPGVKALTRRAALRAVSLHTSRLGMPAPLVGSRAILEHQNAMSDAEGLERIEDEEDLADRIAKKLLVPVPTSIALTVNGNLPVNHRYCRPWTALFLSDLARSHAAEFHRPLEVSSAVRTVAYQKQLMEINGNAAAAEGDIVSPHLTGATIDIAKSPLSRQEIAWMREHLLPLEQAGKIDVEEEFQQACFHITVYKSYAPMVHHGTRSTATPLRAAKQKSAEPETTRPSAAQTETAQAVTPHAVPKRRHHARQKVVAQVDVAAPGMAARGR